MPKRTIKVVETDIIRNSSQNKKFKSYLFGLLTIHQLLMSL